MQGFRGPTFPPDIKQREIILLLGDSTVYGWGVTDEQTFAHLLQTKLDEVYPARYWVVNAGVPAYSSYQALLYFKQIVNNLHPSFVITYLGANDCWNEGNYWRDTDKKKRFVQQPVSFLEKTQVVQMVRLVKALSAAEGKTLRVLPDEFAFNIQEIERITKEQGGEFMAINPLYTDFSRYYERPQDLLMNVKDVRFLAGKDQTIIKNLGPDDYVRPGAIDLSGLQKYPPEDILMDYFHPTILGHQIIANILFDTLRAKISSPVFSVQQN
jgi:lysophospholipase L1-like esterase